MHMQTCKTVQKTNMSKCHVQNHVMQKQDVRSKSCHATAPCKTHAKTMSKTMQNRAKQECARRVRWRGVYAGQVARPDGGFFAGEVARQGGGFYARQARQAPSRTLTVFRVLAIRAICAKWVLQGKPLNLHSPRVLAICAICAIWLLQGKPLNLHSSPGPCYMYYMCYMALYSTYSTDFRAYRIIVGERRLRYRASMPYSTYSTYSKEPGDCAGSAAWRTFLFSGGFPNGFYST